MARTAFWLVICFALPMAAACADEEPGAQPTEEPVFDIGTTLGNSFSDLALLPTRLTAFNMHEDAAIASYTCCHPDQEEQIEQALEANAAFLELYPTSDYADDALIHSARVNAVKPHMPDRLAALNQLALGYPDSDLWDDAMWELGQALGTTKEYGDQIDVLTRLVDRRPNSVHADDALLTLARTFAHIKDEPGALQAMERLASGYPSSEFCDDAYYEVGKAYMDTGRYGDAIGAFTELMQRFPMSDFVDDAQFNVAQCLRHAKDHQVALDAYRFLLQAMPGSPLCRSAMQEINSIMHLRDASAGPDFLDLNAPIPADEAQDLWEYAQYRETYREYDEAIRAYRQFISRFPGHDNYDDAWFHMGLCYQQTNRLFRKINNAPGPDQLYKLEREFRAATGMATIPSDRKLSAVEDAVGCFAVVVNNLVGSNLRPIALREISKAYEQSDMPDEAAQTYQEMTVYFPYATEPDDGDKRGKGALAKTLGYYADPAHYPDCAPRYRELSRAYPDVFPPELSENRDDFLTAMHLMHQHADHAFYEMTKHIPYRLTVDDLRQDTAFIYACLNMQRGQYTAAARQLEPLVAMRTSDFAAPATYVYARALQMLGQTEQAAKAYQTVIDVPNPELKLKPA